MLAPNIEAEVRKILEKHGGYLRTHECSKKYAKGNKSLETKFYRWSKKVEKGKVKGFRIVKLPGNLSFIMLESVNLHEFLRKEKFENVGEKGVLSFKDAFLLECFKELEDISRVGAKNPALGLNQLRLFVSRLPDDLKGKLEPLTEEALDVIVSRQNELEKQFIIPSECKPKLYALYFQALKLLLEEVSKTLHEYQIEKV
jgi:hypothetical protein